MKRLLVAAVLAGLTVGPAFGAHWTVDRAKSRLAFSVMWSGEPFNGVFKRWSADIDFDPADPARGHVVATIETASESSDSPDNDEGVKGALGFAADRFPTARFEARQFERLDDGSYLARGTLTIRGISRPVVLPFRLNFRGNDVHMTGQTTVVRTEFGVGQGEWTSAKPVAHDVTVTVDITAVKN